MYNLKGTFSIKEAFDNLPDGICYFNKIGLPVLCNYQMNTIFFQMTGHDLQHEVELASAVSSLDNRVFHAPDGTIWEFQVAKIVNPQFDITEYIAHNITQLYQTNEELRLHNKKLEEIIESIEATNKNIAAISREEELLSMKMKIHGEMGKSVLSIHKFVKDSNPSDKRALLSQMRKSLALLKGESEESLRDNPLHDLIETANAIGAKIEIDGQLSSAFNVLMLEVAAIRECLINTIKYAGGDTVYVDCKDRSLLITNNGCVPSGPVVEGGGLSSLREKIEKSGGRMKINHAPRFQLDISLPKEELP